MSNFWRLSPLLAAALGCSANADVATTIARNPAEPTRTNATPGAAGDSGAAGAFASSAGEPGSTGAAGALPEEEPSGGGAAAAGASSATSGEPGSSGATSGPTGCEPGSPILVPHVVNARDLGGLPLVAGGSVGCGAVFRGPPLILSKEGCDEAARLGVRTLIDLRVSGERDARPDAPCVAPERVHAPLPIPYGLGPSDYLADLHEKKSIAIAFRALGDPAAYPVYLHCTYGRDRTGVVIALWLLALGASRETVMQDYLRSGASVGAYPDSLAAVLDEIESLGGAEAVLRDAGITTEELAAMRRIRTE